MTAFFVLATIGLTTLLVEGSIFAPVRRLLPMLECYQCTGFWAGGIIGALMFYEPAAVFLAACSGSFLSVLGGMSLDLIEALCLSLVGEQSETRHS